MAAEPDVQESVNIVRILVELIASEVLCGKVKSSYDGLGTTVSQKSSCLPKSSSVQEWDWSVIALSYGGLWMDFPYSLNIVTTLEEPNQMQQSSMFVKFCLHGRRVY